MYVCRSEEGPKREGGDEGAGGGAAGKDTSARSYDRFAYIYIFLREIECSNHRCSSWSRPDFEGWGVYSK